MLTTDAAPGVIGLAADLQAEGRSLDQLLAPDADLGAPTPAEGWSVRDTIVHLYRSDAAAHAAAAEPDQWENVMTPLALAILEPAWEGSDDELLATWRAGRDQLVAAVLALPDSARIPWYGPPMGARSFLTARLMETWAHGQDIADAYGQTREATARLHHVADLGVRTRGWSYLVRGMALPDVPVRVVLVPPDGGEPWSWGPADAENRVSGSALDFCLLVTQRRHRSELDLDVDGPAASEWMSIAQAFAGGPTDGRPPPAR